MLQKIKSFVLAHKIIFGILVVLIITIGYFLIKLTNKDKVNYVTDTVKIGNIMTTVTGTGQVEASNTINLKTGVSGNINYVGVKSGDIVKKGKLIASVDSFDAKMALENAKISLEKLVKVDSLDLLKEENSLKESYDSGWNKVSSFTTDTTKILDDILDIYSKDGYLEPNNSLGLSNSGKDKISKGEDSYYDARNSLDDLVKIYKNLNRSDSNEKIKDLIKKSYDTSAIVATAVKDTEIAINYVSEYLDNKDSESATSARTIITSWSGTSNSYVNDLLSSFNGIDEIEKSLEETKNGADELDIRSAELSVQSKLNSYNDCFVYAPFDGVIATLTAKVGESSGSSVGTIITPQKVVTVSLNEVDIASVSLLQKVNLTFDAINDLNINGEVAEIDSVGTVSSGVVTYNVKITLNEDDVRVKAGMSANVEIITASKKDILIVLSSAIKTKNEVSYVEVLDNSNIIKKKIQIGISDDTVTEVVSGLNDGDKVITKSVSSVNINSPSKNSSIGGGMGGGPMGVLL